ncbi:CARDB domain-containing protein [Natrononativus amylolyticus]|uniref:CARDB domain-containing protein n=1 Tax=Natrononativus amylolyticus TaxID=2963434 RepID=UPI0020CDBB90|nr:CARDB domain-containing protein [Natrononativus amylolyticus]
MGRVVAVGLIALLVCSLPMGVVAAAGLQPASESPSAVDSTATDVQATVNAGDGGHVIERSIVLRQLPDRPGEFEAEITVSVPEPVTELEMELPSRATVESTDGFEPADDRYEWDGSSAEAQVTAVVDANVTGIDHHRASTGGAGALNHGHDHGDGYAFVDTGSWGVVQVPQLRLSWRHTEPVSVERTATVDGPGATGGDIAYLGEVTEYERTVRGETIRLVVPEAADLVEPPEDVLEALATASDGLEIGPRNEAVFVLAAPTAGVDWGPRGIQYGVSDAWVADDARLDSLSHVWFHEYVHTRQSFARTEGGTTAEAAWLVEAQAEYHAALLALEAGYVESLEFRRFLEGGTRAPYADDVLADPATWTDERTPYAKGPLVYGAIDRQLRLESDGEYAIADVTRALTLRGERVDDRAFLEALEARGGAAVEEYARHYTETADAPATWNRFAHAAAFEGPSPAFRYGLGDAPLTLSGEAREKRVVPGDLPAMVTNESLEVPVAVENRGDRAGTYDAVVTADGRLADRAGGSLEAGAATQERLRWTPTEPGTYDLLVGDDRLTVAVREPAEPTVTALSAAPSRVDPGEPVTVTATVENRADRPTDSTLEFRTADGVAAEKRVALGAGETTTLEVELRFEEAAAHEVAVGDERVTVVVGDGLHVWTHRLAEAAPVVVAVGVVAVLAAGVALLLGARR